ncbi:hypothetical protein A8F94_15635 [Bacillus sp. FJAT-27225]|uniref:aspartyl-phosphate phosphatase Spo0E family protein n=1 Tax=Bacillus sp. FJAT-27225 TaxID=1743144 RepID=UPI00080C2E76|nr:aspartyl-phosphate phosphatase Spo0E family protein [Bacillus sp. FJAT-27225]OCA84152.1 hypothetical protein A8F94_15635 [Bacillus sp. FJAT-27225]
MKTSRIFTPSELHTYIEYLRKEMITASQDYGIKSNQSLEISQELDYYIYQYQLLKENSKVS